MGAHANLLIACTQVAGDTSSICFVIVLIGNVTQHGNHYTQCRQTMAGIVE